jgi:hypothetical protein
LIAFEIVKHLHATPADKEHAKAKEEFWLMEQQYEMDKKMSTGKRFELFATPANRRRALVGFLLMWGDQFLGMKNLTLDKWKTRVANRLKGIFVMTNYGLLLSASFY